MKASSRSPSWRWSINALHAISAPRRTQKRLLAAGLLSVAALVAGCRQDMQDQPKEFPQRSTAFFSDGRSARLQVVGTVARGQLHEDSYFYTGLSGGQEKDQLPFPVTLDVLRRGQERFNVYCTPCHSRVGNGAGMIVQRGYKPAGNFHDAQRLAQPLSHYFYVMSNGYGAMPDYAAQLTPEDRWAVAAYIRALQLSQNATEKDVPSGTEIRSLPDVAQELGEQASFAGPWEQPSTAIEAKPSPTSPAAGGAPTDVRPASKNKPEIHAPAQPAETAAH